MMYCYFRIPKRYLVLFWFTLIALTLITLDAISKESFEAATDIKLQNGVIAWLHGKNKGDTVTIGGRPASPGLYTSSDGNIAFTVGVGGKLTAPVVGLSSASAEKVDIE